MEANATRFPSGANAGLKLSANLPAVKRCGDDDPPRSALKMSVPDPSMRANATLRPFGLNAGVMFWPELVPGRTEAPGAPASAPATTMGQLRSPSRL